MSAETREDGTVAEDTHKRLTPADVPAPRQRPIMTAGVILVAVAILAVVIIVPSLVHSEWDLSTAGAWPLAAVMALAFCVPCVITIVVVVMLDLMLRRKIRYVLATVAYVGASVPFCIAFMACVSETDSQGALVAFNVLKNGMPWFVPALGACGVCLGLSLPVATKNTEAPLWERPVRARAIATVGVLAWAVSVYQLVYNLAPYFVGSYAHGSLTYFISQSLAAPATAFLVSGFVFALGWTRASFNFHKIAHECLLWIPLAIFVLAILNSLLDTVTLHGSYSLSYATYLISGVYVLETCLLGIFFGVGLSGIAD